MTVSQYSIAAEVGVTQKTVSLYFKDKSRVGPKTRERIEAAVRRHKYFPNSAARSMRKRRFHRIGCVVMQYGTPVTTSQPQLISYLNGAFLELAAAGYSLVFESVFVDKSTKKMELSDFFSMRSVDAILGIPGGWVPPELDERIAQFELPVLWLNRSLCNDAIPSIVFDEAPAIRVLIRRLARAGHRRVGWMGPKHDSSALHYSQWLRHETLVRELAMSDGMSCVSVLVDPFRPGSLSRTAHEFVSRRDEFDVAFFFNFYYREAAFRAARALGTSLDGLKILHFLSEWERNIGFTGCFDANKDVNESEDKEDISEFVDCILLPEVEQGRRGARYLLSCLEGKPDRGLLKPLSCRVLGPEGAA